MSELKAKNGRKMFVFEGSQDEFEQIQDLFESGKLSELLGIQVLDVGIVPESQSIVDSQMPLNLSQWLKGIVEAGWQTLEALFNTEGANPAFNARTPRQLRENDADNSAQEGVSRGKLIDLGMQMAGHPVALVVTLMPAEADEEMNIRLRVYPSGEQIYLPPNLQLIVLDEFGTTIPELLAKARSADNWIQLEFSGNPGERFGVKVALEDVSITENFVV